MNIDDLLLVEDHRRTILYVDHVLLSSLDNIISRKEAHDLADYIRVVSYFKSFYVFSEDDWGCMFNWDQNIINDFDSMTLEDMDRLNKVEYTESPAFTLTSRKDRIKLYHCWNGNFRTETD